MVPSSPVLLKKKKKKKILYQSINCFVVHSHTKRFSLLTFVVFIRKIIYTHAGREITFIADVKVCREHFALRDLLDSLAPKSILDYPIYRESLEARQESWLQPSCQEAALFVVRLV